MKARRWKAFVRLSGESKVDRDEDILTEFKGFAQALRRIGIDYSIILSVEDHTSASLGSRGQVHSTVFGSANKRGGD